MPRAVITLPEQFIFSTEIAVRITDVNYGGHLGNDSLLSIIHESRIQFLMHHGFSEKDVGGFGIIMADCVIVYKSEAFHGDVLKIEITVDDFGKRACDFIYKISRKEDGKEVARAKTRIAFYDYRNRTTVVVPGEFRALFSDKI